MHTSGPWRWEEVPLPGLGTNRWCEVLSNVKGTPVLRHQASDGPSPWRINPANARLIKAAPKLLEALKNVMSLHCAHPREGEPWVDSAARAVIAEAEGT